MDTFANGDPTRLKEMKVWRKKLRVIATDPGEDVTSLLNSVEVCVSVETSDDATSESGRTLGVPDVESD